MPDEMPPRWMWHLDDPLEDWFVDVEQRREERHTPDSTSSNEDSSSGMWVQNEYAKGRR